MHNPIYQIVYRSTHNGCCGCLLRERGGIMHASLILLNIACLIPIVLDYCQYIPIFSNNLKLILEKNPFSISYPHHLYLLINSIHLSAILPHSIRSAIFFPAELNFRANSLSVSTFFIAFANLSASLQGTTNPFSPSVISSLAPPGEQSVETDGIPIHIASINVFGRPSKSEDNTNKEAVEILSKISLCAPISIICSVNPYSSILF